jgi:uncharacterized Fe-S cluster-containing radical SAM superfamily protein
VNKLRISGGEPTLGKEHLLQVLSLTEAAGLLFILETNGILLGHDAAYARALAHYRHIHMRVSLKAGSPTGFQARTGARGEFWELPFQAIEHLQQAGVPSHVAAMTDPSLMPAEERQALLRHLQTIGYKDYLEEETCDPYPSSLVRLKAAGFHL